MKAARALLVLVALGGVAGAGEIGPFSMTLTDGPPVGRPSEVRYVPRLGLILRYGSIVFLYDGTWWQTIARIDAERFRLDVVGRDGLIAFELTSSGNHAADHIVCWRDREHAFPPQCLFE
jgi:hypothetical protein